MEQYGVAIALVRLVGVGAITLSSIPTYAQIVPDDTLGNERSRITRDVVRGVESDVIDGGARRGQNLFHSFEQFDVEARSGAYFDPSPKVNSIFARVTGNDRSAIRGTLGVLGNADLFLINPNGVLFGSDSSLDLGGSLTVTSADAIRFSDRGNFSAADPEIPPSLLTVNPSAFLFNDVEMGNIIVAISGFPVSNLTVDPGEDLSLLGGNITIYGRDLTAWGGRINIGAVDDVGEIALHTNGEFDFPSTLQRGDVYFSFAQADVSARTPKNGGSLSIFADRILLTNFSSLQAGIVESRGSSERQAGDIRLDATGRISLAVSAVLNEVSFDATGNAGNIRINTPILEVGDSSRLSTVNYGTGNAGDIIINSSERVAFDKDFTFGYVLGQYPIATSSAATGNAGNIRINTPILELLNAAQLDASTYGMGNAGSIIISASEHVSINNRNSNITSMRSGASPGSSGNAGTIEITTPVLEVLNRAYLSVDTFGDGNAGNIFIRASERVTFDTNGNYLTDPSGGASSTSRPFATGDAGTIEITTSVLEVLDGAVLGAGTAGEGDVGNILIHASERVTINNARISTSVFRETGTGGGGKLEITTSILEVLNGAVLAARTLGDGDAGEVIVNASERATFQGTSEDGEFSSGIIVGTGGPFLESFSDENLGDGGTLEIRTPILEAVDGAQLNSRTYSQGNAGDIIIESSNITFQGTSENGRFSSGAFSAVRQNSLGSGGNITIDTTNLTLSDHARISTRSNGAGRAGDVTIQVEDSLLLSDRAAILAQSDRTPAGNIYITVGDLFSATNSDLRTSALSSSGGNIRLRADAIRLFNNSDISTNSSINGGNIILQADSIVALDDSDILAYASDRGGDILLSTNGFFGENFNATFLNANPQREELNGNNRVDINAAGATSGTVSLPDLNSIQNSLAELPQTPIDTDDLLASNCVTRTEDGSVFLITGAGGLPDRPGEASPSSYSTTTIHSISTEDASSEAELWQLGDSIEEPQGLYQLSDGRLMLSQDCD